MKKEKEERRKAYFTKRKIDYVKNENFKADFKNSENLKLKLEKKTRKTIKSDI